MVKNSPANAGDARDAGSIPGKRRSLGRGNGNPLQYSRPGKSHGQRSLVGSGLQGRKDSNATERLSKHPGFHKEGTLPLSENNKSTVF